MTTTTEPTPQERISAAMRGGDGVFYTLTEYGRGQRDYVRVFVTNIERGIVEITYHVAKFMGEKKITPGRGIAFGGGGYSKALEAADYAARAVHGRSLDQTAEWREL